MDFDLRLLIHARALAEQGSFANAARVLHLTQSALSRSIQELERRLGIKLFDRTKSRVEPTELGHLFLTHARELLDRADSLNREAALLRGSGTGRLTVGSGTFPTVLFMGEAVATFLRRNPHVGIQLSNDNWVRLLASLRRRELDLAVVAAVNGEQDADVTLTPLSARQPCFVVRRGHPLLAGAPVALDCVAAYPIASTSRLGPVITDCLLHARGGGNGPRPIPDVGCESMLMLKTVAASTDHVLMTTLLPVAGELERGELAVLPILESKLLTPFGVARLTGRTLAPIAQELVDAIVEADRRSHEAEQALVERWLGPGPRKLRVVQRAARNPAAVGP